MKHFSNADQAGFPDAANPERNYYERVYLKYHVKVPLASQVGDAFWSRKLGRHSALLDVGCGNASFLGAVKRSDIRIGVDLSRYILSRAREQFKIPNLIQADATALPFRDNTFDAVVAFDLLEHIPEPSMALKEIARCMSHHGLLAIRTPNPDSLTRRVKGTGWFAAKDPSHVSLLTPDRWLALVEVAGFEIVRVFGDGPWDPPYFTSHFPRLQKILFGLLVTVSQMLLFEYPMALGENLCILSRKK